MGSAACYYLAKQGAKVLGIEQFTTGHEHGSHTGQTRLIRKAYFEHPDYVPLLKKAYENWREIENETSTQLYYETGIAYFGFPGSEIMDGSKRSAQLYNIPLTPKDTNSYARQLGFHIPENFESFSEPEAGFLLPDLAIKTYAKRAQELGAEIITDTSVVKWRYENNLFIVETIKGTFTSARLIITAGSWTSKLLPEFKVDLKVTRQLLAWAQVEESEHLQLGNMPCWFIDDPNYGLLYGFPILPITFGGPGGMKLAHHSPGTPSDPDNLDPTTSWKQEAVIRYALDRYLPSLKVNNITFKHCLYTYTPDSDFIVDTLPGYDNKLTIACGFSGHGFKFASAIGEILSDLSLNGATSQPIGFLRLKRFLK
jgi:sarcosine oxidase